MIKELKRCSKCGIISLNSNFHKKSRSIVGLTPHCKLEIFYIQNYQIEI